jgi:hypothetical protein
VTTGGRAGPAWRAWPLPASAGLLPLAATLVAWRLSTAAGLAPDCNPFWDGCTSISRAARHGLGHIVFQALVIPAAVLQGLVWGLVPAWLRTLGDARPPRAVAALGATAAVCLVAYAAFLGTDGEGYRFVRRWGTALYFGFSCIAMLLVAGALQRLRPGAAARVLVAVVAALPLLGLVHVFVPLAWPAARDALENTSEWWAGAIFVAFFVALAGAWRASGLRVHVAAGAAPGHR